MQGGYWVEEHTEKCAKVRVVIPVKPAVIVGKQCEGLQEKFEIHIGGEKGSERRKEGG